MGWPEAKIKTPPPWKKECHYTDKSRDVMEITPPSDLEICLSIDFAPLGPRDCPLASPSGNLSGLRVHILHPSALGIALGLRPRAISRASGCKINASANLSVLGGRNFHYIPPIVSVILHFPLYWAILGIVMSHQTNEKKQMIPKQACS